MPMHCHHIRFVFLILAVFAALGSALTQAQTFDHVVIDPGHGGKDPGSLGFDMMEKHLTLDLAKKLEVILKKKGIATTLTRRSDVFIPLEKRATMANRSSKTLFVSLHFNAHVDRSIAGTETFYFPGSNSGRKLASYVQGELGRRLSARNRGFKPQQLKVLEATRGTAVLIECGFISNRWECQRCSADWYRQILAEEIAQGLLRFRDSSKIAANTNSK